MAGTERSQSCVFRFCESFAQFAILGDKVFLGQDDVMTFWQRMTSLNRPEQQARRHSQQFRLSQTPVSSFLQGSWLGLPVTEFSHPRLLGNDRPSQNRKPGNLQYKNFVTGPAKTIEPCEMAPRRVRGYRQNYL